jgi:hypothetical protein
MMRCWAFVAAPAAAVLPLPLLPLLFTLLCFYCVQVGAHAHRR